MLQAASRKFLSGCMMLARRRGDAVDFLGSAFLVDARGYLLTAAHLVATPEGPAADGLVVVANETDDGFQPMTSERVATIPVVVAARDAEHDVALLRMESDVEIGVPDDFLGTTASLRPGASVMALGYAFGHEQVHTALAFDAVVSAKIESRNGTSLILYSSPFHEGDRGGPLIHVEDGHVIGIVSGRFDPARLVAAQADAGTTTTDVSYAVAIEYGLALMERIPELERG
jgi:S1-C subfamily serine protease